MLVQVVHCHNSDECGQHANQENTPPYSPEECVEQEFSEVRIQNLTQRAIQMF
jgi:hypothetical protein